MASKADAVCLALVTLWRTGLAGVEVRDGPQADSDAANKWLFVASDGNPSSEGSAAVSAQQDWQTFMRGKLEVAEVTCAVLVRAGEPDTLTVRALAYGLFAEAEDLLRADYMLGGLVMQARVSSHHFYPAMLTAGAKARVVFTVNYQAQI